MEEMRVQSLGWEDPLQKEMAIHSNILAWENLMDRGDQQAKVHGVKERDMTEHTRTPSRQHCCCCRLLQSCQTLCDPIDGSPSGCTVPGILQARTLERVAISFANAGK